MNGHKISARTIGYGLAAMGYFVAGHEYGIAVPAEVAVSFTAAIVELISMAIPDSIEANGHEEPEVKT